MIDNRILIVNSILDEVAKSLDIPPSKYKLAVERYTSVGNWLEAGEYPKQLVKPKIYPQGSFRLGTVIRPIKNGIDADYDIDLVCELNLESPEPAIVKQSVGGRLKAHGTYRSMLDKEGKRCWTLLYAEEDDIGFHLDVLPSIPSPQYFESVDLAHSCQAISLTDKGASNYSWGSTNPGGFAAWFDQRNSASFIRVASIQKSHLLTLNRDIFASVADVPDQLVRTPLQRAIQILKRHRDVRFAGSPNERDKPISMIITTLVALSFKNQNSVYETLATFLDVVQRYSETGIITCEDDEWRIENPVNPDENFANRWNDEESKKPDAFFEWINWVQEDIDDLLNVSTSQGLETNLRHSFGSYGTTAANKYSGHLPGAHQAPISLFGRVAKSLLRFDASHRQQPKWHIRPTRFRVGIDAKWTRNGFRPTAFRSNAPALLKGLSLRFDAKTDVPKPYEVYWQVVNTGAEAMSANGLRGEFYDSQLTGRSRTERTGYSGMHWVECFVVKDNVCVARSGEFVVNVK